MYFVFLFCLFLFFSYWNLKKMFEFMKIAIVCINLNKGETALDDENKCEPGFTTECWCSCNTVGKIIFVRFFSAKYIKKTCIIPDFHTLFLLKTTTTLVKTLRKAVIHSLMYQYTCKTILYPNRDCVNFRKTEK